jgi:hypothetical protein
LGRQRRRQPVPAGTTFAIGRDISGGFAWPNPVLWRHPEGWMLGHILAIVGIIEAIFVLLGTGNLGYALASTAFPFLLLWYLNRASVKKAFGILEE